MIFLKIMENKERVKKFVTFVTNLSLELASIITINPIAFNKEQDDMQLNMKYVEH